MTATPPTLPWRGAAVALALAVLVVGGLAKAFEGPPEVPPTETVQAAPFVVSLKGVGDLVPAQRHMVAAPFSAKLDSIAEDGTEVKAGDVVAKLNTQDVEEAQQEEELRQAGLLKDEDMRALTVVSRRKKYLTDRRSAVDNLALRRLELRQLTAGLPKADVAALALKAQEAIRTYSTASESFHLQEGLLTKGIIRPIDLDQAKVDYLSALKGREVATTALAIARHGYPVQQVEVGRLALRHAQNDLLLVDGELASLAKTSVMEGQVAEAERAWSRARLLLNQHKMASASLRAATAGVVVLTTVRVQGTRKKLQVGDEAQENQDFMEIADVHQVFIKTEVKEVDIGRVKVGMPAKIHVASLNKTFEGKLERVGVLAYENPDVVNREGAPKVFEGRIAIADRSAAFRPGMTVDVELIVDSLASAITVPNGALATHGGETSVWLYHPGGLPERRVVTAGEHTEERTVITAGLAAGNRVMLDPQQ